MRDVNVDGGYSGKNEGKQDCEYPDTSLQAGVESEWSFVSIGQPAEAKAAESQSAHKGGDYSGCGKGCVAKNQI